MAEIIRLKTKARELFDYSSVDISQFLTGFTANEEQLEKDIGRMLKKYGRREKANIVENGDSVMLKAVSEEKRFNKPSIPVIVGKGVFSAGIEKELVGMGLNETKALSVSGVSVEVTVLDITHVVLPELTDESIASLGIEGIASVADLRRVCIERQIEQFILEDENPDMASAFVWQTAAKNCSVERDEGEAERALKRAEQRMADMNASEPAEDEADDEESGDGDDEFGAAGDVDDGFIRGIALAELDLAAVGSMLMEQDGKCITTDDYENYIDKLCGAYPDRTREEMIERHTMEEFAIENYANFVAGKIDAYIAECYKRAFAK